MSFLCTNGTNRNAKFNLVWVSHASGFTNQKAGRVSKGYVLHSELIGFSGISTTAGAKNGYLSVWKDNTLLFFLVLEETKKAET